MVMTKLTVALVFVSLVSFVLADSSPCSATEVVGLSYGHNVTLFGSTINAPTYGSATACNSGISPTVWFTLTPPENSVVTVTTCGDNTNFDTILGLYYGDCGDLACYSSNDDTTCATSRASTISFQSSGEQAYINLSGYSSIYGNYQVTFSEVSGPVPSCSNAEPLAGPFFTGLALTSSTVVNGDTSTVSDCGLPSNTNQVWYTIQTDSPNPLTITTCGPNTDFDTVLAIFTGNCSALECFLNNDDNCTLANAGGASTLRFTPTPNEIYYLVVSGYSGSSGMFDLKITQDQYDQDGCDEAYVVNLEKTQSIQGTTIGGSVLRSSLCGPERGASAWYSIYSPSGSSAVELSICGDYTDFDATMSIYSSCDNGDCITTTSGCAASSGYLNFPLAANQNVFLVVASGDGSAGSFEIEVSVADY